MWCLQPPLAFELVRAPSVPMPRIVLLPIALAIAASAVVFMPPAKPVQAGELGLPALCDSDGDFLPDAVEWVMLTNAASPDTDGDGVPDFVEVVQQGNPRSPGDALPLDQEMRVVVTGPTPGFADPLTWLHVFLRILPPEEHLSGADTHSAAASIDSFSTWLELAMLPGLQFPLDSLAAAGIVMRERATTDQGDWLQISVPLTSATVLQALLPCTIWCESTVGGKALRSGVKLIAAGQEIVALVPYSPGRFVVQSISPQPAGVPTFGSTTIESNRVCVLDLQEAGAGPGGTIYEVVAAACEDCNDLECNSDCSDSLGWLLTIPGGTSLIGGQ